MLRGILAVIAGAIAGSVFNMGVIMLSWALYPLPEGADITNQDTMRTYVAALPLGGFVLVLVAHAGGALVGGVVGALIARRTRMIVGAIVGALFLIGGILNLVSIPCPLWFAIADTVAYVPCGLLGALLVPRGNSIP